MALVEVVLIKSCPFKITLYELAEITFEFAGADQDKLITSVDGSVELDKFWTSDGSGINIDWLSDGLDR